MNTAIQKNAAAALDGYGFDRDKIDLIKRSIAPGVTDAELQLFLYTAHRCGLDPLARQIYCIKRNSKDGPKTTIQTSIDGYRLIADRTGNYAPGRAPTFEEREDGSIISATAYVWKCARDTWHEVAATAYWDEYVALYNGKPQNLWSTKPHVMISKCAEALALRRAFPAELSGLYTQDEMQEQEQPAYLDVKTGEIVEKPVKQLAASPPAHRVLTPDPAAAKQERLIERCRALVKEAESLLPALGDGEEADDLGAMIGNVNILLNTDSGNVKAITSAGKDLADTIALRRQELEDEAEDLEPGSFVEVVEAENVELFPNGVPV